MASASSVSDAGRASMPAGQVGFAVRDRVASPAPTRTICPFAPATTVVRTRACGPHPRRKATSVSTLSVLAGRSAVEAACSTRGLPVATSRTLMPTAEPTAVTPSARRTAADSAAVSGGGDATTCPVVAGRTCDGGAGTGAITGDAAAGGGLDDGAGRGEVGDGEGEAAIAEPVAARTSAALATPAARLTRRRRTPLTVPPRRSA